MAHPILHHISDAFSILTIAMCLVLKVPQIKTLLSSKSTVGISIASLTLELVSYTIVLCYNIMNEYTYLSYLEYPFILIQEYVLMYLVLKFSRLVNIWALLATSFYIITLMSVLFQVIPKRALTFLLLSRTPISASSKVAQFLAILRAKNADSVSALTWFISALSSLTRAFTIWMDSADVLLLGNLIISAVLSSSIMFTVLYYRNQSKKID